MKRYWGVGPLKIEKNQSLRRGGGNEVGFGPGENGYGTQESMQRVNRRVGVNGGGFANGFFP